MRTRPRSGAPAGKERFLKPCRRHVAAGFAEAAAVETDDVLHGGDFALFSGAPWPCWFRQLGREQPDDGLSHGRSQASPTDPTEGQRQRR